MDTVEKFRAEVEVWLGGMARADWSESFRSTDDEFGDCFLASAVIPLPRVDEFLKEPDWDSPTNARPGCIQFGIGANSQVGYFRFGNDEQIEPFVLRRHFHRLKPEYFEILEEFRLLHNLFDDRKRSVLVKIADDGNEHDVVRIEPSLVRVRAIEVKQFLGIKDAALGLMFDIRRRFDAPLSPVPQKEDIARDGIRYRMNAGNGGISDDEGFVRIHGKVVLSGFSKSQSGVWPYDETDQDEVYLEFITGTDNAGKLLRKPCDPHSGVFLTRVYFRREVLGKYYNNPQKYSVEDGYLRCGGLWGLPMDNDNQDYVVVFLGDLGQSLPESERHYWLSFNIPPAGPMSETSLRRNIMAEFADATRSDLVFKESFQRVNDKWEKRFGWPLFRPLTRDDEHFFTPLHVPATNDQSEFDGQVLALAKVLVDSLNEEEIAKQIVITDGLKGLRKLETFLQSRNADAALSCVQVLRDIQSLRSAGTAHRKGDNYKKLAEKLGLNAKDLRTVFNDILTAATSFLATLESELL